MEKENIIKEKSELKINSIKILKGTLIAIINSILFLLIFAMLLCYTEISENTIKPVVLIITGISILIGSVISTRKIRKNGLINGGVVGFTYVIILYIISSLVLVGFSISFNSVIMLLIATITGMLGGIIGINLNL